MIGQKAMRSVAKARQCFLSCNSENIATKSVSCDNHSKENLVNKFTKDASRNLIIGIDPGLTGAIAVIRRGTCPTFVHTFDMPLRKIKDKNRLDLGALSILLESYSGQTIFAMVEEVGQIGTNADPFSAFVFGFATGAVHGVLEAFGIDVQVIRPNIWKAAMGLSADKSQAIAKAIKLFPGSAGFLTRKMDHGRAEALLLAHFGNSFLGGRSA